MNTTRGSKKTGFLIDKNFASSIRTSMLIKGTLEGTEANLMHFKWEVT